MATAYTPILQLALPVTGELQGTWGTVVNDNITSMIEQAIAGLATISTWTAASHTLTTANGTTDEARCAVLECSGAPGAAATVVCPALSKVYVIKNSVTGGYAVTLKTSAGTGISVPNGSTALLYCDGTNVVSGATYMATLSTTQVDILAQGDLRLQDTTGGEYVALQAPATIATSYTLTLPTDDGTAGQALITDGSGVLSWSTAASGDVYGPASATDNAIARFDLTTGKIIQNSVVTIDDTGNMAGVGTLSASGQLTLTNASNYNLYASGVGANFMQGKLGIGSVAGVTVVNLLASNNATGNTGMRGIHVTSEVQSDVTNTYSGFDSVPTTAAAAFTLTTLNHFRAAQGTIGAGSTVTNQYGFRAGETLTGATNNYGFFGNIAAGTGLYNFYANGTAANAFAGTTSLGGLVGSESLRVTPMASAVNYIEAVGAITANTPTLKVSGSDTNIPFALSTKGSGGTLFYTSDFGNLQFAISHTATTVNYLQVTGAATLGAPSLTAAGSDASVSLVFNAKTTGTITFGNSSGTALRIRNDSISVNFIDVFGNISGQNPLFRSEGSDTNIGMSLSGKGTGGISFQNDAGARQFFITPTASAVNYLQVTGAATGAATALSAQGSDTNIDLALTPKGTGVLAFGTLTANADAPITGYITIKDAGGTTRKLAIIA